MAKEFRDKEPKDFEEAIAVFSNKFQDLDFAKKSSSSTKNSLSPNQFTTGSNSPVTSPVTETHNEFDDNLFRICKSIIARYKSQGLESGNIFINLLEALQKFTTIPARLERALNSLIIKLLPDKSEDIWQNVDDAKTIFVKIVQTKFPFSPEILQRIITMSSNDVINHVDKNLGNIFHLFLPVLNNSDQPISSIIKTLATGITKISAVALSANNPRQKNILHKILDPKFLGKIEAADNVKEFSDLVIKIIAKMTKEAINKSDTSGQTPLALALNFSGKLPLTIEAIKVIINKINYIDAQNSEIGTVKLSNGENLAQIAAKNGHVEFFNAILDPKMQDDHTYALLNTLYKGRTLANIAAINGRLDVVKLLLGSGSDINPEIIRVKFSPVNILTDVLSTKTGIASFNENKHSIITFILNKLSFVVNKIDELGESPLIVAIKNKQPEDIINLILETIGKSAIKNSGFASPFNRADKNAKDQIKIEEAKKEALAKALDYAIEQKNGDILAWLLNKEPSLIDNIHQEKKEEIQNLLKIYKATADSLDDIEKTSNNQNLIAPKAKFGDNIKKSPSAEPKSIIIGGRSEQPKAQEDYLFNFDKNNIVKILKHFFGKELGIVELLNEQSSTILVNDVTSSDKEFHIIVMNKDNNYQSILIRKNDKIAYLNSSFKGQNCQNINLSAALFNDGYSIKRVDDHPDYKGKAHILILNDLIKLMNEFNNISMNIDSEPKIIEEQFLKILEQDNVYSIENIQKLTKIKLGSANVKAIEIDDFSNLKIDDLLQNSAPLVLLLHVKQSQWAIVIADKNDNESILVYDNLSGYSSNDNETVKAVINQIADHLKVLSSGSISIKDIHHKQYYDENSLNALLIDEAAKILAHINDGAAVIRQAVGEFDFLAVQIIDQELLGLS